MGVEDFMKEQPPKAVNHLANLFGCIEVQEVLNKLVSDVEYKLDIDKAVKYTLNRIITKLESMDPHFHQNQAKEATNTKKPKIKYLGRQARPTLTWVGNKNCDDTRTKHEPGLRREILFTFIYTHAAGNVDITCAVFEGEYVLWLVEHSFCQEVASIRSFAQSGKSYERSSCEGG